MPVAVDTKAEESLSPFVASTETLEECCVLFERSIAFTRRMKAPLPSISEPRHQRSIR